MLLSRFTAWMFCVAMLVLGTGGVSGQDYPNKPIRFVTSAVGGASDIVARLIAPGISVTLGQQVIVDNRPVSVIAIETVAKAQPDGYTLLVNGSSLWIVTLLQKTTHDAVNDFLPVTATNRQPNVLVVHPSLPVSSVKELIALGKARPGELNYASSDTGSSSHLAAELFKHMAGVKMQGIPYKGGSLLISALLGGHVQLSFATAPSVTPHTKVGRLRALAVTSAEPSVLLPGLPTVAASGLPGYEAVSIYGIFAPAKTPATFINRLNQEIVRFLKTNEAREKFLNAGVETIGSSPQELGAIMKSEIARMGKVIKDAGIRTD